MSSATLVRGLSVSKNAGDATTQVPKRLRLLRWVFGIAGIAFLVIAFRETWRRSQGLPIPKAWAFLLATILTLVGLFCLAHAWMRLFGGQDAGRSLATGFFLSQLGRYIPGAVWQALAQVGLATQSGIPLLHASTAFGAHALVQLAAGGIVGATLAVAGGGVPVAARLLAPLALLPLLLLRRRWLVRALQIAGRLLRRTFADDLVPPQRAIVSSFCWTLCAVVANSVAFSVLLISLPGGAPIMTSTSAFALAWLIGFLAVPFPSGIGVREAVLLLTIGFEVPRSHVIAASVGQRLVLIAADVLAIVSSRIRLRARPSPSGAPGEPDVTGP
jgi:hypothetical protein